MSSSSRSILRLARAAAGGTLTNYINSEALRYTIPQPISKTPVTPEPSFTPFSLESFMSSPVHAPVVLQRGWQRLSRVHCNIPHKTIPSGFSRAIAAMHALGPVGIELCGNTGGVRASLLACEDKLQAASAILHAHTGAQTIAGIPGPLIPDGASSLVVALAATTSGYHELLDCASRPFSLLAASILETLHSHEFGVFQVIALGTRAPWQANIAGMYGGLERAAQFGVLDKAASNAMKLAQTKTCSPLFWVATRLAAYVCPKRKSIVRRLFADALGSVCHGGKPLRLVCDDSLYRVLGHDGCARMIQSRTNHTTGILLNADELAGLIALPERNESLRVHFIDAFASKHYTQGLVLGRSDDGCMVRLPLDLATRGVRVLGNNGSGKTNLLALLCKQLIELGYGFALFDPHGDIDILEYVSTETKRDVVVFDPTIADVSLGYCPLNLREGASASRMADSIMHAFAAQSSNFRDVMQTIIRHAAYALLRTPGTCLADMKTILQTTSQGRALRSKALQYIDNPECKNFFLQELSSMSKSSLRPVFTLLSKFLLNEYSAKLFTQTHSVIDVRAIMDEGKILFVRLPVGIIGDATASLIGSVLLSDIYSAGMSRIDTPKDKRRFFMVLVDEFHRFVSTGGEVEGLLRQTRKFNLATLLATQDTEGLQPRILAALENAASTISFSVGESASNRLAKFFDVSAKSLRELPVGRAMTRLGTKTSCIQTPIAQTTTNDTSQILHQSIERYYTKPTTQIIKPVEENFYDDI